MNKSRIAQSLALAAIVGGIIPFVIPSGWLSYVFSGAVVVLLVLAALAAGSADDSQAEMHSGSPGRFVLWLIIGTERPTAKVKDMQALILFYLAIAFLAGLAIGAFGAVHA
jgi:hypothetical protein